MCVCVCVCVYSCAFFHFLISVLLQLAFFILMFSSAVMPSIWALF